MSVDSLLDAAFTTLLGKAQQDIAAAIDQPVRPATIESTWSGGGQALTIATMDPVINEVPFASNLVWVHLFAGDNQGAPVNVTAQIDLHVTQLATFGASQALNGTGLAPSLVGGSAADIDITGWQQNINAGDVIIAVPKAFSGLATWLTLTIQIRPTNVPVGDTNVTDNSGSQIVDNNGNPIVVRA